MTNSKSNTDTPHSSSQVNSSAKKVCANGKVIIFTGEHDTLLESLEAEDIEVHYHCRDGFCGACRVKLNQGEIHYPQGEPLAFVGDGEILPCCCIPKTDIELEIE